MVRSNRRQFLKRSGETVLVTAAAAWSVPRVHAAGSDRVVVGIIGVGGMGNSHLEKICESSSAVELAYLCDVDSQRLETAAQLVQDKLGQRPKTTGDMRMVLEDARVAAVFVATPDHWHAPATILACEAGKHVYVEKPCSHNVREGRLMLEAARQHQRVVQVGTQSRSTAFIREAIELVQQGKIGDVLTVKVTNSQRRTAIGKSTPSAPPEHLAYDAWIGPTPMVPFRKNVVPGRWRWWYNFGTGDMGNDGVHDIDLAWWALGVETHPTRVTALGGRYYFDDDREFPDTQTVICEYPSASGGQTKQLIYEQRDWSPYNEKGFSNGFTIYGTKGYLDLGHGVGYRFFGENDTLLQSRIVSGLGGAADLAAHHRNFLDCIRSGERPNADIEIGHRSATICHLGNIATRVGRVLNFDPVQEKIVGDEESARLIRREYRAGHWAVPRGAEA